MAGIHSIEDSIKVRKLGFVASTVSIPAESLAHKILETIAKAENFK